MTDLYQELAKAKAKALANSLQRTQAKIMSTSLRPDTLINMLIPGLGAGFEIRTGETLKSIECDKSFCNTQYELRCYLHTSNIPFTKTFTEEALMSDSTQVAEQTLDELVDWFMTERPEGFWPDHEYNLQELKKQKESEIDIADMML